MSEKKGYPITIELLKEHGYTVAMPQRVDGFTLTVDEYKDIVKRSYMFGVMTYERCQGILRDRGIINTPAPYRQYPTFPTINELLTVLSDQEKLVNAGDLTPSRMFINHIGKKILQEGRILQFPAKPKKGK